MTLFNFLKKKTEPEMTVPADGTKALIVGMLFEKEGAFLKWGSDIEAGKLYVKKEYRADRMIYQWGERTILNGLTLPFKTVCWNQKQHGDIKAFESIEFLSEDDNAGEQFDAVRKHVQNIFGEPKQHEDINPGDVSLEWRIKEVKISLNLFNKERAKVHLEIGWWI